MAAVWRRAALTGYAHIFPESAPKPTHEQLAGQLREVGAGFVYEDGGTVVGLVQVDGPELLHLYVDPPHWRRGIGGRLHDAAVDAIRRGGHAQATLWTLRENAVARSMYEAKGWRLTDAVRTVYAPAGIDDVSYVLDVLAADEEAVDL